MIWKFVIIYFNFGFQKVNICFLTKHSTMWLPAADKGS